MTLNAGGTIDGSSGTILAASLTGSSVGSADFSSATNTIGSLGAFSTSGGDFSLRDASSLLITGVLNAAGHVVTLRVAGSVSETTGTIAAATLTGTSTGNAAFANTGNQIGTLGAFDSGTGTFILLDGSMLAVSGADVSALGFTGVKSTNGAILLQAGGPLSIDGAVDAGSAALTLVSTGDITESATGLLTAGTLTGH